MNYNIKTLDVHVTPLKDRIWVESDINKKLNDVKILDTGSCGSITMLPREKFLKYTRGMEKTETRCYGGENHSNRACFDIYCNDSECFTKKSMNFIEHPPINYSFDGILSVAKPSNSCSDDKVCSYSDMDDYECLVVDLRRNKNKIHFVRDGDDPICRNTKNPIPLKNPRDMGMSDTCNHLFVCNDDNDMCSLIDSGHPPGLLNTIKKNNFIGGVVPVSAFMDNKTTINYKYNTIDFSKV